jgi:cytoplasmic iron level regulating protein YaaA (DUF328/UPF0246 family)
MMQLSDALAELNHARFASFAEKPARNVTKQAGLAFNGDTYRGLRFETLTPETVARAQERLCILSGLYGVLRPLDAIQPYRLEMGRKLKTARGTSLYAWWGDRIADAIAARVSASGAEAVVNLASVEYFGAVRVDRLPVPVIAPVFQEEKAGTRKVISFCAKVARGAMARWMLSEDITDPSRLSAFAEEGYRYDPATSAPDRPVFVRAA